MCKQHFEYKPREGNICKQKPDKTFQHSQGMAAGMYLIRIGKI